MPTAPITAQSSSKPATKNSVRHSFNLSSVSKALADVINKDGGTGRAKDAASRRSSSIGMPPNNDTPRTSFGDKELGKKPAKPVSPPDVKTITRKTRSSSVAISSAEDSGSSKPEGAKLTRASSLRPRNSAISSALPKYKPRPSVVELPKKSSPPARAGTRRKHSSSEDDKIGRKEDIIMEVDSPDDKASRPISPIPRRATAKLNPLKLSTISSTPPSADKRLTRTPPPSNGTPTKLVKLAKLSPSTSTPRPPSSSSSSPRSLRPPTTPPTTKRALGVSNSPNRQRSGTAPSPLRSSIPVPESPLGRRKKISTSSSTTVNSIRTTQSASLFTEGASSDSIEARHIEYMLPSVVSPTAATPALPRIRAPAHRRQATLQTPARSSNLAPPRNKQSVLVREPSSADASPSPPKRSLHTSPGSDRTSLLSWEQLAAEGSRMLGEDEVEGMLADIPAPFHSGLLSPTLSEMQLDIHFPDSPSPSGLPSPGGYTSISQVLLPDVTPSPAVHHSRQIYDSEIPAVDAAIVTLLRLQLVSAENSAKERLMQIQSLEDQLHRAKESRILEERELATQVSRLEEQLRSDIDARTRTDDERAAHIASLEDQLRHVYASRERVIAEAVAEAEENAEASAHTFMELQRKKWKTASAAQCVSCLWDSVRDMANGEVEYIKASRDALAVLLAGLDDSLQHLHRQRP